MSRLLRALLALAVLGGTVALAEAPGLEVQLVTIAEASEPAPAPPPPDHCSDYHAMEAGVGHPENQHWFNHQDARGYARVRLACIYGGGAMQWNCLEHLWGPLEGNWDHRADNPYSSAYGIPQALPGSKMGPGWQHDPRVQVRWGLEYVRVQYDTPCEARAFRLRRGWY